MNIAIFDSARGYAASLLLMLGSTVLAQTTKPSVTWLLWDFPPSTISSGGQPSAGYIYAATRMLADAWPEAQHKLVLTTTDNAWASLNRGVEACYVNAILTPERERSYYLTQTTVIPPLSIVARAEAVAKMPKNDKGEVLAGALFDRQDLRGILADNRSYSVLLDALLRSRAPGAAISTVKQLPGTSNILQMLASNRGDYTIEYAVSTTYQLSQSRQAGTDALKALPIAGLQPIPVGVACPRTPWGRETIVKVDFLLPQVVARPDYFDALKRWQPIEVQRFMEPHLRAFVKQRTQRSYPAKFGPP